MRLLSIHYEEASLDGFAEIKSKLDDAVPILFLCDAQAARHSNLKPSSPKAVKYENVVTIFTRQLEDHVRDNCDETAKGVTNLGIPHYTGCEPKNTTIEEAISAAAAQGGQGCGMY
ncbi:unnamed protein product [Cylicostephanus goldi]|uniref:Uncharacterized protein n=1 Tax=Cylicostephanus goldi TaxID=71465 RepID=A0A3P6RKP5_CYLGO|nr:unnamed protein product [Cylicostephanus goldi]